LPKESDNSTTNEDHDQYIDAKKYESSNIEDLEMEELSDKKSLLTNKATIHFNMLSLSMVNWI
jgi:hypothetical protein